MNDIGIDFLCKLSEFSECPDVTFRVDLSRKVFHLNQMDTPVKIGFIIRRGLISHPKQNVDLVLFRQLFGQTDQIGKNTPAKCFHHM